MQVCNHKEADTRIFVHVRDAVEHGAQKVLIRTVDKDVVIIAIVEYSNLCLIRPDVSVWMAFGMRKHFQYISIDTICEALGPRKAKAPPLFHAISGCDATSSFQGKGKKSEWDAWNAYEEVNMEAFLSVLERKFTPLDAASAVFSVIERFVVVFTTKTVLQARSTPQESSSPRKGDLWKVFRRRRCVSSL